MEAQTGHAKTNLINSMISKAKAVRNDRCDKYRRIASSRLDFIETSLTCRCHLLKNTMGGQQSSPRRDNKCTIL